MFFGVHLLLYSRDPEADRAFFRDVLEISVVDAGHGWLIFALPPAELGIHPAEAPALGTTPRAGPGVGNRLHDVQEPGPHAGHARSQRGSSAQKFERPGGG